MEIGETRLLAAQSEAAARTSELRQFRAQDGRVYVEVAFPLEREWAGHH